MTAMVDLWTQEASRKPTPAVTMDAIVPVAQQIATALELPDAVVFGAAEATYKAVAPALAVFEEQLYAAVPGMTSVDAWFKERQHPMAARLPLMQPSYVLFGLLGYVVLLAATFVIGKLLGKMKHQMLGAAHNIFLFLLSLYMWAMIAVTAVASYPAVWNVAVGPMDDPNTWRMAKLIWLFYVSKLPEFVDTALMMLKQNYRQVSFLHLYHHATIFTIWFVVCNAGPGGDAYWSAMLNSGIHVIMYGYYGGTLVLPAESAIYKFLNRHKYKITTGQMTQFALNVLQSVYLLCIVQDAHYPSYLIHTLLWYMFTLLALFGNFMFQGKKQRAKDKKEKKA